MKPVTQVDRDIALAVDRLVDEILRNTLYLKGPDPLTESDRALMFDLMRADNLSYSAAPGQMVAWRTGTRIAIHEIVHARYRLRPPPIPWAAKALERVGRVYSESAIPPEYRDNALAEHWVAVILAGRMLDLDDKGVPYFKAAFDPGVPDAIAATFIQRAKEKGWTPSTEGTSGPPSKTRSPF